MKLSIIDNSVAIDENGTYTVPDDIPMPILFERFEIVNGSIVLVNELIGKSNSQVIEFIEKKENISEYNEKVKDINSRLIAISVKKAIDANKIIIDKDGIEDKELDDIRKMYTRKYNIAKKCIEISDCSKFEFQAEEIGVSNEDLASTIINEYETGMNLSDRIFDAIEARRIKVGKLITTFDNGLDDAINALLKFEDEEPDFFVQLCVK